MSEPIVILAPNAHALKHARRVASDLSKLGFQVGGSDGRLPGAQLDKAHKVVLLWSGGAARAPALKAAARRAKAKGKLVTVRIDSTRPPAEAGRAVTMPRGRQTTRAWRRLLGPQSPTPTQTPTKPAPRKLEKRTRPTRGRDSAVATSTPPPATRQASVTQTPVRSANVKPASAPLSATPRKRGMGAIGVLTTTLFVGAFIAIGAGAVFYVRDATFAAQINAFIESLN